MSLLYPRHGVNGNLILKHSLHSSSDDDFSELDMPSPEERCTRVKLMTEKPIHGVDENQLPMHSLYSSSDDEFSELGMPVPEEQYTRVKLMTEKPIHGVHGNQILKHSLHSSSDGEVSEMDMPVPEECCTHVKLMTEKPNESLNCNLSGKAASGVNLSGEENPKMKTHPPKKGNHLRGIFSDERHAVTSGTKDTEDFPIHKSSNFVTIEKVPTTISLNQLRKAVSEFGEIVNASTRYETDGFNSCDVEFKTRESKDRAVASGKIIVKLCHLPIRSLYVLENIAVRISNISSDTGESAIHSMCMLCGPVEGLSRTNADSVDVVFTVKDSSASEDILEKLNGVCAENRWSAAILTGSTDPTTMDVSRADDAPQVEKEAGSELTNLLEDVQRRYQLKKMLLEDLARLHQCVVHLQSRPMC